MTELTMMDKLNALIDQYGLCTVLDKIADICDENAIHDVDMTLEWTHTADELRELTTLMDL